MKKALVVGINYYEHVSQLFGCVNDAHSVKSVLERNSDGSVNFDVRLITATCSSDSLSRTDLKAHVTELFSGEEAIALFYFAGHGHIESTGGYLCGSDCKTGDDGLPLSDIITIANASRVKNRVIVLDSCYSGIAGSSSLNPQNAELKEGTTILTASTKEQYAAEKNGSGVFTTLLVDAMMGGAGNLVGDVTPGSVYAHIDQSLGNWEQRPIFKTNVQSFVSLRKVQPPIPLADLQRLAELFPVPGFDFALDPSFEPERQGGEAESVPPPKPENTRIFAILQKYNRVNLVVPVDAPHMWHAAMHSKSCRLTVLGEHYRQLVARGRI